MGFTTTIKKKVEKTEKYPEIPVMTQVAVTGGTKENTVFELNMEAMKLFGFALNTANVSKITVGYNDNQDIALAAIDLGNTYTSNVTAKNTFSNKKLLERLVKTFEIEPSINNEFLLMFDEVEAGAPQVACLALILPDDTTEPIEEDDASNGIIADEIPASEPEFNGEVIEVPAEEAPEHSMDDIPTAPTGFESREATFEADETTKIEPVPPHVIKIGVPTEAIVEKTGEDW